MRIGASPLRVLAIVALSLLAAGCATPPPKPAFVAYGTAGTFGYSDTRLADDLYQVTYVTPYIRTATDEAGRTAELAQQKQQAYELALWRAAQLAEKAGYPAMQVETVDPGTAILDQIVLSEGIASSTAGRHPLGSLTWNLNEARHVYALRLRYEYIKSANPWPTLHAYWSDSATQDFNIAAALFSIVPGPDQPTWALVDGRIQTNAKLRTERTLTIWVDAKIDRFRIYLEPCEVRFSKIELLVPAS